MSSVDGAVGLSAIPLVVVERIEVLKDGAAAIYGSDAIGGVANIVARQHFTGTEGARRTQSSRDTCRSICSPDRFTRSMLDYVNADIQNHEQAITDELDSNATAALADLPEGPLVFAAGFERRLERGEDDTDR